MRYSLFSILAQGIRGNKSWRPVWRDPSPKSHYDIIIIGGGGHGLSTAYYLAKIHKRSNIAVLEKGWLGNGNVGRNTTIIRSNYMLPPNTHFYEHSMKLWENLEKELNFNAMVSQRGIVNLFHSDVQRDEFARRGNAMRLAGVDAELLDAKQVKQLIPIIDIDNARFPIEGGLLQPRAGTARHDAVAWGYARGADALGVDIVQNCEVVRLDIEGSSVRGVHTNRGDIRAERIGIAVAGHTSVLARMAGIDLPVESHLLQAFVSEAIKPMLNTVVTFGAGHFYASQSDKGGLVFGGDLDRYNSYAQRGNLPTAQGVLTEGVAVMPSIARLRLLRQWGGVMDMSFDGSPFICKTPINGLYLNGGWCYGGFKATPASGWCFAHTIANDETHELNAHFTIDRFKQGKTIDEKGAGPFPWAQ